MHIEIAQIFTQIVSFIIVFWVLKRYAWKPLLGILEEREQKIKLEFQLIEQQKQENAKLLSDYQNQLNNASKEVKELIKEGREEGLRVAKETEVKAQDEAKKMIAQTKEELKKEIYKAKNELKKEIIDISLSATEKLLKSNMDTSQQKAIVEGFILEDSRLKGDSN